MARVTVEDSLEKVSSRFELTRLTIARIRQLKTGAPLIIEQDEDSLPDKYVVLALREIATGKIDPSIIETSDYAFEEAELKRTVQEHDQGFTRNPGFLRNLKPL